MCHKETKLFVNFRIILLINKSKVATESLFFSQPCKPQGIPILKKMFKYYLIINIKLIFIYYINLK